MFRASCPERAGPLCVSPQCLAYSKSSRCSMKQVPFTRNHGAFLGLYWAGLTPPLLPLKVRNGLRRRPVGEGPAAQACSQTRPPFSHSLAHLQTAEAQGPTTELAVSRSCRGLHLDNFCLFWKKCSQAPKWVHGYRELGSSLRPLRMSASQPESQRQPWVRTWSQCTQLLWKAALIETKGS